MGWNGSGDFSGINNFEADSAAGPPDNTISSAKVMADLREIHTGLENCMTLDGQTSPSGTISMNSQRLSNLANAAAAADAMSFSQVAIGRAVWVGTFAGTATAITASLPFSVTLTAGMKIRGLTSAAATGAATIALNGGSATSIKQIDRSTDIAADDWGSSDFIELVYNGTVWFHNKIIDELKLKTRSTDTTPGFLDDKIIVSGNISKTITGSGANERIQIGFSETVPTISGNASKIPAINSTPDDYDYLDYGTSGNDTILQLDSNGRLPALDGRNLTEIARCEIADIVETASFFAPTSSVFEYRMCFGSSISRTTYSDCFEKLCPDSTGDTTNASAIITNIAELASGITVQHGIGPGTPVEGANIPSGTTVLTVDSATQVTLSANATGTTAGGAIRFLPHGVGDGSTTFDLPDKRGRVAAGNDAMGGTAASRLTQSRSEGVYGHLGATGGEEDHTQTEAEMPSHTHSLSPNSGSDTDGGGNDRITKGANNVVGGVTVGNTGGDEAHNNTQPTIVENFYIRIL